MKKGRISVSKTLATLLTSAVVTGISFLATRDKVNPVYAELEKPYRDYLYELSEEDELFSGNVNPNISYQALEYISSITLDLKDVHSLNDLRKFKNIKRVSLKSAEWLTEEDIEVLKSLNLESLDLHYTQIDHNKEKLVDISLFESFNKVNATIYSGEEFASYLFYDYFKGYVGNNLNANIFVYKEVTVDNVLPEYFDRYNVLDEENDYIQFLSHIDNRLDLIIKELNLSEDDDMTKIYKIANYVMNRIEYNPMIRDYCEGKLSVEDVQEMILFSHNYSLSSILFDPNEISYGMCINYSYLFEMLCYKAGIKVRVQGGHLPDGPGHVWDVLYLDKNDVSCLDLVCFDNSEYKKYIDYYLSLEGYTQKGYLSFLKSNTLIDKRTYDKFELDYTYEELDSKPYRDLIIYNEGLDGKYNYNINYLLCLLGEFGFLSTLGLFASIVYKNEELEDDEYSDEESKKKIKGV